MTSRNNPNHDDLKDRTGKVTGHIMEGRLWAPWRMKYIESASGGEGEACFLCENPRMEDSEANLILRRGKLCFVIMNLYPYNNGHLMIAPYRHIGDYLEMSREELSETNDLTRLCVQALEATMHPHGYNIGMNLGRVAGAGVEDHIHLHIVPRWNGDTNFMPVIAETKVVSESLHEGWRRLRKAFENLVR